MAPPLVSLPSLHLEFTLPRTMEQHVASQPGCRKPQAPSLPLCPPRSLCPVQLVSLSLSSAMGSFLLDYGRVGVKMSLAISWSPGPLHVLGERVCPCVSPPPEGLPLGSWVV